MQKYRQPETARSACHAARRLVGLTLVTTGRAEDEA
jgi:hypothetical protein